LAAALVLSAGGLAEACEAGICVERIVPADGDEIPTNAQMWVFFDNVNGFDIEVRLLDEVGVEVPASSQIQNLGPLETLTQSLLHLVPDEPLEPGSNYGLIVAPEEDLCGGANTQAVYTVLAGTDDVPPAFEGIETVDAGFIEDYSADSNCTGGPPRHRYTALGAPSDDAVAYHLYEDGRLVALAPAGPRVEGGGVLRPENVVTYDVMAKDEDIPNRCFVMRAVDIAGNEDLNDDVVCVEEIPEGDDDDSASGDEVGGCACEATPSHPWSGWMILLALWVLRRRSTGD